MVFLPLSRPSRSLPRSPNPASHTPTPSPHQKTVDNSPKSLSLLGAGSVCGWRYHNTTVGVDSRGSVSFVQCIVPLLSFLDLLFGLKMLSESFGGARRAGRPLLLASGFTRAPASIPCRPRASRSVPSACLETRAPVSSSARASRGAEGDWGAHTRKRQHGQAPKESSCKHTENEQQLGGGYSTANTRAQCKQTHEHNVNKHQTETNRFWKPS